MGHATKAESALLAQEHWLRSNGLPLVVPPSRRLRGIVPRTVPLLVTFALLATALVIADAAVSTEESIDLLEIGNHPGILASLAVAALTALLAIPLGVGYAAVQRRMTPRWRLAVGLVIIAFWTVGLSLIAGAANATQGIHVGFWPRLGLLLVAALIGFYGLGSMAGWAARRGARELAATIPAVARILPLLLLTVLLVFFTNELWQLSATIGTTRMWLLSGFLSLMILLIALPATLDMIDDDHDVDEEPLLEATPFAGVTPRPSRLSLGERFNLLVVSLSVQFVQVFMFVVITFAVFALFGAISLSDELIATWTGQQAQPLVVLGLRLPMEAHMFRVCTILALFSGISFSASTLQDKLYRTLFLDRVADEVQRNLAARNRYRTTLVAEGKAPSRWHELAVD